MTGLAVQGGTWPALMSVLLRKQNACAMTLGQAWDEIRTRMLPRGPLPGEERTVMRKVSLEIQFTIQAEVL